MSQDVDGFVVPVSETFKATGGVGQRPVAVMNIRIEF